MSFISFGNLAFGLERLFANPFKTLSSYSRQIDSFQNFEELAKFLNQHEARIGMAFEKAVDISSRQAVLTIASLIKKCVPEGSSSAQRQLVQEFYNKWLQDSVDNVLHHMESAESKSCYEALLKALPHRKDFIERNIRPIKELLKVRTPGTVLELFSLDPNLVLHTDCDGNLSVPNKLIDELELNLERPQTTLKFLGYEEFIGGLNNCGHHNPYFVEPARRKFMSAMIDEAFQFAVLAKTDETVPKRLTEVFERMVKLGMTDADPIQVAKHNDLTLVRIDLSGVVPEKTLYLMSTSGDDLLLQVANHFLQSACPSPAKVFHNRVWQEGQDLMAQIESQSRLGSWTGYDKP